MTASARRANENASGSSGEGVRTQLSIRPLDADRGNPRRLELRLAAPGVALCGPE